MRNLIRDRVEKRAALEFVGRAGEVRTLLTLLDSDGPRVVYLHGIGGIGKSALVAHFARIARSHPAVVVQVDGRSVEPTEGGFLAEVAVAIGSDAPTTEAVGRRLTAFDRPVVVIVDTWEVLRLLDSWMRRSFIPSLPQGVRVVLAGREPPVSAWLTAPGWRRVFRSLPLDSLPDDDARELLARLEIEEPAARRVQRYARGHPLALRLAAAALAERPDLDLDGDVSHRVLEELTHLYLDDVGDELTRRGLEAVSVVRRITSTLLAALLPDAAPRDVEDRLRPLPFVASERDGLVVHDVVREAIARSVQARDPIRYRSLRRAAWAQLERELDAVGGRDLWRYTADMLYLVENPVIREAFFPSNHQPFSVEPAAAEHHRAVMDIVARWEGSDSVRHLERWWGDAPGTFRVVRDPSGDVAGFYCLIDVAAVSRASLAKDPVAAPFIQDLAERPPPDGQRALVLRKWLCRENGEAPSPVQAACWLDVKRVYVEMRDVLRRVYVAAWDVEPYAGILPGLGFCFLDGAVPVGGRVHHGTVLDFGPGLVGGWMRGIVSAELGVESDDLLDGAARELALGDRRVALTAREFEVMRYLHDREGGVAERRAMLAEIWGIDFEGSSNVVDVVIRALRRKLGAHADTIETVRGVGYRYRAPRA